MVPIVVSFCNIFAETIVIQWCCGRLQSRKRKWKQCRFTILNYTCNKVSSEFLPQQKPKRIYVCWFFTTFYDELHHQTFPRISYNCVLRRTLTRVPVCIRNLYCFSTISMRHVNVSSFSHTMCGDRKTDKNLFQCFRASNNSFVHIWHWFRGSTRISAKWKCAILLEKELENVLQLECVWLK